jgi:hypothetical protein
MNAIIKKFIFTTLVTLAVLSVNVIKTSPIHDKSLHKRSSDENLYHEKNSCILACGECAEEDLNNMNEEVKFN